jgi:hypothetical protein
MWGVLAGEFAGATNVVGFDLLNELCGRAWAST